MFNNNPNMNIYKYLFVINRVIIIKNLSQDK